MFFQQQKDSDFEEMEAWLNEQVSTYILTLFQVPFTITSPSFPPVHTLGRQEVLARHELLCMSLLLVVCVHDMAY